MITSSAAGDMENNRSNKGIIVKNHLFLLLVLSFSQSLAALTLADQCQQTGFAEIVDSENGVALFDALYAAFDDLIEFLHTHPAWTHKLYSAKERFIRSREREYYSTDFFGFYDELARDGRQQAAFYYSIHFHEHLVASCPGLSQVPQITDFLEICFQIQKSYEHVCCEVAAALKLEEIFASSNGRPPILLKIIKYLPSYSATKPHYDGTAFSLFLDSTDNQSLLLAPYRSSLAINDFTAPTRTFSQREDHNSVLLAPGTLVADYGIYPTPHIVIRSGKTRYATIAFVMRPFHRASPQEFCPLPTFNH